MIIRKLEEIVKTRLFSGKAVIVIGARQTGKTTSINNIISKMHDVLVLNGDDAIVRTLLSSTNTEQIRALIGTHKIVFIDEVQRIENIGLAAKIITDYFKEVQLILSGSSSFEIKNSLSESLTGRKWEYVMYPVIWSELEETFGYLKAQQQLELRLIYGMYPEIITHPSDEQERLKQLIDSYLYKDLLAFSKVRKPEVLEELLQAVALQMGNEVSFSELSQLLKIDKNTVKTYLEILEKGFIIFTLSSYSNNLRDELKFAKKIFFWDNGIRNAIIHNFNPLSMRNDVGALWENFLISERIKKNHYAHPYAKSYFWRTVSQQEIDYIEECNGEIKAFEFKWNKKKKAKKKTSFSNSYQTDVTVINSSNFRELFLS